MDGIFVRYGGQKFIIAFFSPSLSRSIRSMMIFGFDGEEIGIGIFKSFRNIMKIKNSFYYQPYQFLEKRGISFADFAQKKNYYNQLAFLFEAASSRAPHTKKEANFIISVSKKFLAVKHPVFLDAACGTGRHDRLLSKSGFAVTGIDSSAALLKIARKKDKKTTYQKADLRTFRLKQKFDCIFSFWEAYNYLSRSKDIAQFVQRCFLHLKPRGILILDSRNFWRSDVPQKKLQSRSFRIDQYDVDLIMRKQTVLAHHIHEGIFIYFLTHKNSERQNIIVDQELIRIYNRKDLLRITAKKFDLLTIFGDFNLNKIYIPASSERMIVVFRKI